MRAGALLLDLHAMAAHAHAHAPKTAAFSSARGPAGLPRPAAKRAGARHPALARRGSGVGPSDGEAAGVGGSYLGAEAAALLACVTATLLVLPLLLPPLPPPPPLFLLVPVAIFAVLLLLVLVPSDAAVPRGAATVGVGRPSSSSYS